MKYLECFILFYFFFCSTSPCVPRPTHYRGCTITLRHPTLGRIPLDEWWVRSRDQYLTTRNTHTTDRYPWPRRDWNQQSNKWTAPYRRLRPRGHCDWLRTSAKIIGNRPYVSTYSHSYLFRLFFQSRPTPRHTRPPAQWVTSVSLGSNAAGTWHWVPTRF